jgi:hypothetical protein
VIAVVGPVAVEVDDVVGLVDSRGAIEFFLEGLERGLFEQ